MRDVSCVTLASEMHRVVILRFTFECVGALGARFLFMVVPALCGCVCVCVRKKIPVRYMSFVSLLSKFLLATCRIGESDDQKKRESVLSHEFVCIACFSHI